MVQKSNGKWRMCVNFINLNLTCPKSGYPLPKIDALVDLVGGCSIMNFLDAFSVYHEIQLTQRKQHSTLKKGYIAIG